MTLEVGRIYVIPVSYIRPPKPKICLCVCDQRPLFFFINSAPHFVTGHSISIAMNESDALTHDSHLDLSEVFTFQPAELQQKRTRGMLAIAAVERAIAALNAGVAQLPDRQAKHVIAKLTETLPPF